MVAISSESPLIQNVKIGRLQSTRLDAYKIERLYAKKSAY